MHPLSRIRFKDSSAKIGSVPSRIWQPPSPGRTDLASESTSEGNFPSLQTGTAGEAAVGVVAGDLVVGIAEQAGAADRVYANIVVVDQGAAYRHVRCATTALVGLDAT